MAMMLNGIFYYSILTVFALIGVITAKRDSVCGTRSASSARIAGGRDSSGTWPWHVELLKVNEDATGYDNKCGGTLIDSQWVITSASCVFKDPYPTFYKVKIGKRDRSKKEKGEQEIYVESLRIHRDFLTGDNKANDIALLKLGKKVRYGKTARPVCLPEPMSRVRPGKMCVMTGWGKVSYDDEKATILQQARMKVVSFEKCKAKNSHISEIDDWTMLCAGFDNRKTSGCRGDSGGPLVCREGRKWVLRGIISWGNMRCDGRQAYSVFTRVSHFAYWIFFSKVLPPRKYPRCKDNHWHCGDWHQKGLCTNSYYKNSLRKYCPETCRHCKK